MIALALVHAAPVKVWVTFDAMTERLGRPEEGLVWLREAQRRCQQLGQEAASNAECLRVWAETRDRFLGRTRAPAAPASNDSEGR